MKIGSVKEIKKYEYRVGLTPENVREYVSQGHTVFIEKGAGEGSAFQDGEYAAMGATLLSVDEVWAESDMIVKVKEPLAAEYGKIREGQILFTYLHLAADRPQVDALLNAKCKAVAYETVGDAAGGLPLLKPMSEIAGRLSIQAGAKCLEKPMGGMGLLLGGVPGVQRANVVILGGGGVGTNACKMAIGLGANVAIFDTNLRRLEYLDDIFGQRVQTLYSTGAAIEQALKGADLVIGAVLIPGAAAPKLIKREYLRTMKPGGCCETTRATYHDDPAFVVDGVVHYCVANMPGAVSRTSTIALTNATLPYGLRIAGRGLETAALHDQGLASGVNCYRGTLTCRAVAEAFSLPCQDIVGLLKSA